MGTPITGVDGNGEDNNSDGNSNTDNLGLSLQYVSYVYTDRQQYPYSNIEVNNSSELLNPNGVVANSLRNMSYGSGLIDGLINYDEYLKFNYSGNDDTYTFTPYSYVIDSMSGQKLDIASQYQGETDYETWVATVVEQLLLDIKAGLIIPNSSLKAELQLGSFSFNQLIRITQGKVFSSEEKIPWSLEYKEQADWQDTQNTVSTIVSSWFTFTFTPINLFS